MNTATGPSMERKAARVLTREDYARFLPLVRRLAMRTARKVPSHISVSDLVSCGWVGLMEALSRAPADMPDNELEAYASYRVRGAMLDYLRSLDPVAREVRTQSKNIARTIAELTRKFGRPPEEEEIANAMGLDREAYQRTLSTVARAGMARLELLDVNDLDVEADGEGVDELAAKQSLAAAVVNAIQTLPARQQQLLALYYQEDCTRKEIGQILGVSESRVSQLHSEAMHRLRAAVGRE